MKSTKIIPFEQRIFGEIYFVRTLNYTFIVQCKDSKQRWNCIKNWRLTTHSGMEFGLFYNDWENYRDDEIRLATPEEVELLLKADVDKVLEEIPSRKNYSYELY